MKHIEAWALLAPALLAVFAIDTACAAGDPVRGARVFNACASCHSIRAGEQMTGPSLAHVWNQRAGTVPGFERYSDALKQADIVWSNANLEKWLAGPDKLIPGTSMTFPGLRETKDRQDVAAWLKAVSEGKAPKTEMDRSGAMPRQRAKPNLRQAPPEGQVLAIEHCRDTYLVRTADGKTTKVWEYNLRFKSDSSANGPAPRKPVVIGAGMQGDRATVVFAGPEEISAFIKTTCR